MNPSSTAAIAVFVKTPGVSPVKTRLAEAIGVADAERFYGLCLDAVEAVIRSAYEDLPLIPYWAVAEPDAMSHARWQAFERVPQGRGGLGERLHRVYSQLRTQHRSVLLIGADAPLITGECIGNAIRSVSEESSSFALSRARDGGYGLFAGCRDLPETVWTRVPYSSDETANVFVEALRPYGLVAALANLDDVDTFDDLLRLAQCDSSGEFIPEQIKVIDFAQLICRRFPSSVDKG